MPTPEQYVNDIRDIGEGISGRTAPQTGVYYSQIYSQDDPNTGVPTLGVLLNKDNALTPKTNVLEVTTPLPINNLTDNQMLEIIRNGGQISQLHTGSEVKEIETVQNISSDPVVHDGGGIPLMGTVVFIILVTLVGFVYFIIRLWQNNQARRSVLISINKKDSNTQVPNTEIRTQAILETVVNTEANWRKEVEFADNKLKELLNQKGIVGDSISDKLKSVGPGQFNTIDIAWEAHQSAKKLLTAHDNEVSDKSIKRVLQLFKQVFAEHRVI